MVSSTDQLGDIHNFKSVPVRIISLVPSITELLCDLGLSTSVVARTSYCIHPSAIICSIPTVGGTKKIKHDSISELNADIVIANKEENKREDVEQLRTISQVWVSDVADFNSACDMIGDLGQLFDKGKEAEQIINQNVQTLSSLSRSIDKSVLYLIWRKPYMTVGNDTYINDILSRCGYRNVCDHLMRYPSLTEEMIVKLGPEEIFLSSEPYPFKEKHKAELLEICPKAKVRLVDGEFFSWYGSRLTHLTTY